MKYALKTQIVTGQQRVVKNYGDKVWEWLCDTYPESFTVRQAITCPLLSGKVDRTKMDYVRVILNNVLDQDAEKAPFKKVGNLYVWM